MHAEAPITCRRLRGAGWYWCRRLGARARTVGVRPRVSVPRVSVTLAVLGVRSLLAGARAAAQFGRAKTPAKGRSAVAVRSGAGPLGVRVRSAVTHLDRVVRLWQEADLVLPSLTRASSRQSSW
jgi:hypothetical protein